MTVFHELWVWMGGGAGGTIPRPIQDQLMLAILLAPVMQTDLKAKISPLVTVSDASDGGCGACFSTALEGAGVAAMRDLEQDVTDCRGEELGLVELFGGIGGTRRALEFLGCEPAVYLSAESLAEARRVVRSAWPDVIEKLKTSDINEKTVEELRRRGPHIRLWLTGGGFPCQSFSGLNATGKGLADDKGQLVHELPRVEDLFKKGAPEAETVSFGENVASMKPAQRQQLNVILKTRAKRVCPGRKLGMRRPRLLWCRWRLPSYSGVVVTTPPDVQEPIKVEFAGGRIDPKRWLKQGAVLANPDGMLPTFVRSIQRKKPPFKPAGLASTKPAARARWKADEYRFPPYQYSRHNGILEPKGLQRFAGVIKDKRCLKKKKPSRIGYTWRYANVEEREVLMGFKRGHTAKCFRPGDIKHDPIKYNDCRLSLLGNSMQAGVMAVFIAPLLEDHRIIPFGRGEQLAKHLGLEPMEKEQGDSEQTGIRLIRCLAQRQVYCGRDVRSVSLSGPPDRWPRDAVNPGWWKWRVMIQYQWHEKKDEHINIKEGRSYLAALRWRLRVKKHIGTVGLHLMDSQVFLGAMAHGRSSSVGVSGIVDRCNALILASGYRQLLGYVSTDVNPADKPSRWGGEQCK